MRSDEAVAQLVVAMQEEFGAGGDFELDLGELIGRYRAEHKKRMRDQIAAELLPYGVSVVVERLGVCPSTAYKMAHRSRKYSTLKRTA